jgi:hypothetical protein
MKSKPPPLSPFFYGHRMDNSHNSHYALSEEEEGGGGTVSSYLYRGTVATGIVTSAHLPLLMHSSNGCADVTMLITADDAHHY